MPWPYEELRKHPNFSDDEWHDALMIANPEGDLEPRLQHQAKITGRGPDDGWSNETDGEAQNLRMIEVTLPYGFPRIAAETLSGDGIVANIYGMAAPSPATDRKLVDMGLIKGMVSLLGERQAEPADIVRLPYSHVKWADFTGSDQILDLALQFARDYIEAPPVPGHLDHLDVPPAVIFHCAWGLGRTGTALAAYQLMSDVMLSKTNPECQDYFVQRRVKNVEITIHGDEQIGGSPVKKIFTTPGVALAINKVRRSTDPPMVAVEEEAQVRVLERMEDRIAQAMCEAIPRLTFYPGDAQVAASEYEVNAGRDPARGAGASDRVLLERENALSEASSGPGSAPQARLQTAQPARPDVLQRPAVAQPPAISAAQLNTTEQAAAPAQLPVPQGQRPTQQATAARPAVTGHLRDHTAATGDGADNKHKGRRTRVIDLFRRGARLIHPEALLDRFIRKPDNEAGPDHQGRRPDGPRR